MVLGLKEGQVECATLCVKSEVILIFKYKTIWTRPDPKMYFHNKISIFEPCPNWQSKIWYPTEVEIGASGGHLSCQGPGEKKFDQKSSIFEQHKCNIPQKKAEKNCHSDLKQNQRLLYWKSWKKSRFHDFCSQKVVIY